MRDYADQGHAAETQTLKGIKARRKLAKGTWKVSKNSESFKSRTTDTQRGNSLHCTAENSLPIPNV